jgi:hypothetical protein
MNASSNEHEYGSAATLLARASGLLQAESQGLDTQPQLQAWPRKAR